MKKKNIIKIGIIAILLVAIGFGFVSYARTPELVDEERTAWLEGELIAHRGIHDNEMLPENSIASFEMAAEKGNPIELDVRLTEDNKLVVFHDKKLKRMFGIDILLKDITYEELSEYTFENTDETVPLFSEVLESVDGRVPLLVEIKNEGEVGTLEGMLYDQLKIYDGEFAVQSFNPFTVKWFKDNAPEVLRGQLSGSFVVTDYEVEYQGTTRVPKYKSFLLSEMLLNFLSKPNFIAYETENVEIDDLEDLQDFDVPVLGWTIDSQDEYDSVKQYFDNFICNTVDIRR